MSSRVITGWCLLAALAASSCASAPTGAVAPRGTAAAADSAAPHSRDVRCWGQFADDVAADVESLADVLPNTKVKVEGSDTPPHPMTSLVVTGRIVDVVPGRAWADFEAGGGGPSDSDRGLVPFDAPTALWKNVHATVLVEEVLASENKAAPDEVLVAFTLNGPEQASIARDQLVNGELLVFPLLKWAGTDYLPELWAVGPGNSSFLAEVGGDGTLSLPCLSRRNNERLLARVGTVDALRKAAQAPERVITREPRYLS